MFDGTPIAYVSLINEERANSSADLDNLDEATNLTYYES